MASPALAPSSTSIVTQQMLTPVLREEHEITTRGTQKSLSCGVGGVYESSDPPGQSTTTCGSLVFYNGRAMTMLCQADLEKFNDLKSAMMFTAQYAMSRGLDGRNIGRLAITGSENMSMSRLLAPASSPAAHGFDDDLDGVEMAPFLPDDDELPDNTARASGKQGDIEEAGDASNEKKTNVALDGERQDSWFDYCKGKVTGLPTPVKVGIGVAAGVALVGLIAGVASSRRNDAEHPDLSDVTDAPDIPNTPAAPVTTAAPKAGDLCKQKTADATYELYDNLGASLKHPNCPEVMYEVACAEKTTDKAVYDAHREHNKFFSSYGLMYESDCITQQSGEYEVSKGQCDINTEQLTAVNCPELKRLDKDNHSTNYCVSSELPQMAFNTAAHKSNVQTQFNDGCSKYGNDCHITISEEPFLILDNLGKATNKGCLTVDDFISVSECQTLNAGQNDKFVQHNPRITEKYNLMRGRDCTTKQPTGDFEVRTGECRVDTENLAFDVCKKYEGFRENNPKSDTHPVAFCENQRLPNPVNARDYKSQKETTRKELETKCNQIHTDQTTDVTISWKFKGKSMYMGEVKELYAECPTDPYAPAPCDTVKKCGDTTPPNIPTGWKHHSNTVSGSFNAPHDYCFLHAKGEVSSSSYRFDTKSHRKDSNSFCFHTWGSSPYGAFQGTSADNC